MLIFIIGVIELIILYYTRLKYVIFQNEGIQCSILCFLVYPFWSTGDAIHPSMAILTKAMRLAVRPGAQSFEYFLASTLHLTLGNIQMVEQLVKENKELEAGGCGFVSNIIIIIIIPISILILQEKVRTMTDFSF